MNAQRSGQVCVGFLSACFALLLVTGAALKVWHPEPAIALIKAQGIHQFGVVCLMVLVCVLELAVGLALLLGIWRQLVGWGLLLLGSGGVWVHATRGSLACGCMGPVDLPPEIGLLWSISAVVLAMVVWGDAVRSSASWSRLQVACVAILGTSALVVSLRVSQAGGSLDAAMTWVRKAREIQRVERLVVIVGAKDCPRCRSWEQELVKEGGRGIGVVKWHPGSSWAVADGGRVLECPEADWWRLLVGVPPDVMFFDGSRLTVYDALTNLYQSDRGIGLAN